MISDASRVSSDLAARIAQGQAETRRFAAEQNELAEAATHRLREARASGRRRASAPLALLAGFAGGLLAVLAARHVP